MTDNNIVDLPSRTHPGMTEVQVHPRITREQFEAEGKARDRGLCLRLLISALDPNADTDVYDELSHSAACPTIAVATKIDHLLWAINGLKEEIRVWAEKSVSD